MVGNYISALQASVTNLGTSVTNLGTYKVAQPLDGNNRPTNGTSGQSLRTKGDGTTEWADVGLPTDAQTAQAVSDWLDAHPEATTTVQDGSLTEAKFSNALKLKIKGYVTPQMFGAVGDGTTDDTTAFTNFVNASGYHLIPEGTYYIDGMILPSIRLVGVNKSKCILKCKSVNSNGDFLTFNSDSAFSIMETLSINANGLSCNAIGLVRSSTSGAYDVNMTLSDLLIYNAGKDGVKIYSDTRGCMLNRVKVHNCGAWGVESLGTDNSFDECTVYYCHNGFYLGSNCRLVGGKVFCVPYHITEAEEGGTYYAYYVNGRCNVNGFDVQQEENGITACIYVAGDNNTIHGRIDSTNGDYILFADKTNGNDVSLNIYENVLRGYGKGKHAITVPKSCLFNKINIQESKNYGYAYTIEDRSGIIPVLNTGEQNGVSMVETHTNETISYVFFSGASLVSHEDSDNIYTITAKHAVGVQNSTATVRFRFTASKTGIATTIVKVTPSAEPTDTEKFSYSLELYNSNMSTGYESIATSGYRSSAYGGILVGKFNVIAGNTYLMVVGSHGYSPSAEIDTTFTVTDAKIMIS